MAYQELQRLESGVIDGKRLAAGIQKLVSFERARLRRLWAYYRNPMRPWALSLGEVGSERPYRQAQEWGLPSRITGVRAGSEIWNVNSKSGVARKEIVIENDIGWRVDTMVDYLFGKALNITSTAADEKRRDAITRLLRLILARSGGILFLQQLALLGAVYGFVDVVVKLEADQEADGGGTAGWGQSTAANVAGQTGAVSKTADAPPPPLPATPLGSSGSDDAEASVLLDGGDSPSDTELERIATRIRLEIVEPSGALPFLSECDYRVIEAYAQVGQKAVGSGQSAAGGAKGGIVQRLRESTVGKWLGYASNLDASRTCAASGYVTVVEIITPTRWQRFEDETLVAEGENSLGVMPVVHIQNVAMPFEYSGAGDVEPLIPLQDELNTRLSDRAHRISLQSFKMYLGKPSYGRA